MLSAISIAAGYAVLIIAFGWWGLLAAVVHIGIMLVATRRGGD